MNTKNKNAITIRLKRSLVKKLFPDHSFLFCNGKFLCFEDGINLENINILNQLGWIKSIREKEAIDGNNYPNFLYTYPSIHFLKPRLKKTFDILEYGSGNSTLCYAKYCKTISSIENDREWFHKNGVENSTLICENDEWFYKIDTPSWISKTILEEDLKKYPYAIERFNKKFDLIAIDGRERVNCCINSLNFLKKKGVILLNNSERTEYQKGIKFLLKNGFKKIDFFGHAPSNSYCSVTSIFYRKDNILGI